MDSSASGCSTKNGARAATANLEEPGLEHLAAEVRVHAHQFDGIGSQPLGPGPRLLPPEATPNPNLESSWPVRTNSWVWASTPGADPASGPWAEPGHRPPGFRSDRARRTNRPRRRPTPSANARAQLLDRLVVAVQHQAVRRGYRRPGPLAGTPRRWTRRGACRPRWPAGPWPGTRRPWWRSSPRARSRPPPRGNGPAAAPRRRRTAACRTRRPGPWCRTRQRHRCPSGPSSAESGSS